MVIRFNPPFHSEVPPQWRGTVRRQQP